MSRYHVSMDGEPNLDDASKQKTVKADNTEDWPVELLDGMGPTAEQHLEYLLAAVRILRERQPLASGPPRRV